MAVRNILEDNPQIAARLHPKWTEYIPHQPTPKQLAFLLLPYGEALYGGSAGGGKSDALLMAALQYVDVPGYAAIIFRKTLTDLKQPGSLIDRSMSWLNNTPARWLGGEHCWIFPTINPDGSDGEPATLAFGYIGESEVFHRYQSAEYQYIAWDELTQHLETDYLYLFSRRRKLACPIHKLDSEGRPVYLPDCPLCCQQKSVPLRVRSASNPGGPGHSWVKRRFQIEANIDPKEAARTGQDVKYVGKHPKRPFISAFLEDNPYLDQAGYEEGLDQLDPVTRAQLKSGNWGVSPDSRFKMSWAKYYSRRGDHFVLGEGARGPVYHMDSFLRMFATIDPAGSSRESPGANKIWRKAPSWPVISVWGLTYDFNLLWLDMMRFQREIPDIVDAMRLMFRRWAPHLSYMAVETNGLGRGVFQYAMRIGLPVRGITRHHDKLVHATDAMIRMKQGKIWLPEVSGWKDIAEDELFTWTGDPALEEDDIIDTLSDAAKEVSWDACAYEPQETEMVRIVDDFPDVVPTSMPGQDKHAYGDPFRSGS